jgi:short-subunit dehydrogenase
MKKISIISGGSSGLGLEIADLLIKSGNNVLILGRNKEKLEMACMRLTKTASAGKAESMVCNIGDEHDVRQTGLFLQEHGYSAEYLFNNAGQGLFTCASTSTAQMIDMIFEANLKGMILLTSEILRITADENELTIVNIMSTSALLGRAEETIYCAAKFGARGYTEALRTEYKGKNRNIIAVYPGGMRTDFWNKVGKDRDLTNYMDPAEVALKIVNAVTGTARLLVTDITINRK